MTDFRRLVQPYATGNLHPRFMGWVHGGGNPVGMLAELLAGGLNANLGGRDHAPIEVERQVIAWAPRCLGFPGCIRRAGHRHLDRQPDRRAGRSIRRARARGAHAAWTAGRLVAYTSAAAHGCLPRAMEMAGLGREALRMIPCDEQARMRLDALAQRVAEDRADGAAAVSAGGTAGTVDIGAIDDLAASPISPPGRVCGSTSMARSARSRPCAPKLRPLLAGIERADSVAFDFHKWAQVPYDAGCIIVRDASRQSRPSAPRLRICGAINAAWPAAASGLVTWALTCRAVSVP